MTLENCTLSLRVSARNLIVSEARFIHCTIDVKKELKNFGWEQAFLEGCRFTGRLSGNDFGRRPDSPRPGHIQDCDFSAAQLDACRFLGCDTNTLRFPPWPCFTLLDTFQRARALSVAPWPDRVGRVVMSDFDQDPPTTVAVTYSALALARRYGTTPEAIKATLEKLDGVRY